jgi:hypothetical protein
MITAGAEDYALVIANHGPRLTVYDEEECGNEFCDSTVIPIKYTLKIRLTSCAAGTFPTQDGACQKVECPNTQTFPADTSHYTEVGGLRLWSKQWVHNPNDTGQTVASDSAPLIGPPGSNAPTVAVLGGVISYARPNTFQASANSTIMLIQCPAVYGADGAYQKWFDVYEGAVERYSLLGFSPALRATALSLSRPATAASLYTACAI